MKFTCKRIQDLVVLIQEKSNDGINIGKLCNYFCHRLETLDFLDEEEIEEINTLLNILEEKVPNKNSHGYRKSLNNIRSLVNISKENIVTLEIPELEEIKGNLNNASGEDDEAIAVFRKLIKELSRKRITYSLLNKYINILCGQNGLVLDEKYLNIIESLIEYVNNDNSLVERIGDEKKYRNFCASLVVISNRIFKKKKNKMMEKVLSSNNISFRDEFSLEVLNSIQIKELPNEEDDSERILSIDDPLSPDLDGAFSIKKEDNYYVFKVYVTNVPSFLKENLMVAKEPYRRGTSIYIHNGANKMSSHIDMLPPILSWDRLSLHQNCFRDAIVFEYIITDSGNVENKSISIKKINVTENLSPAKVFDLLHTKQSLGSIQNDLKLYREVVSSVAKNSNDCNMNRLRSCNVSDLVAFPSVLINYDIGKNSEFAIYRGAGGYSKDGGQMPYTHSVTPLRRFVSDINLAFFLNQEGVESFDEKKLNYVENNVDEIIEHLNEQSSLADYIKRRSYKVKEILLKDNYFKK